MTWKGLWEGIASFFENVLFIPYDALRNLELDSWFFANIISWILLLIGAVAFIYWMLQLKKFDEDTQSHYTFDETP
ncbi:uracil phosphoribosyltransferase [Aequorivita sp. H23M31]|uniref:Uracil phosphoribosyltransferase n=1 Tax=Aequorivita ciconiae TaxID=2494375 RepID=A0A410G4L0_9FLAO|nr:uracil phosphoribosyltransferase [Aequorivita sp. H23M31]QAA82181.1 uracil phosphoribosyltransferase [Aequorivita sp. H23M31]